MNKYVWIVGKYGLVSTALQKVLTDKKIPFEASASDLVDITSENDLRNFCESKNFTHVINCAAFTSVDLAEKEKERAYEINALGPRNLGRLCFEKKIKCIHLSTDYVFDGEKKAPYSETDLTHPVNWYGYTKDIGEKELLKVSADALIIRTSWIFSERGHHFLKAIMSKAYREEFITVADDQIGKPTYAIDLAKAILACFEEKGIFHFANAHAVSRYEYAQMIIKHMRDLGAPIVCKDILRGKTKKVEGIAIRPAYSALNTTKIEKVLKKAVRGFEEGLFICIKEILEKEYKDAC